MTLPGPPDPSVVPRVLNDADVIRCYDMAAAISAVEAALAAKCRGAFTAPARHTVSLGKMTELVVSIGGRLDSVSGVRTYVSRRTKHHDDQVVVVWGTRSGTLKGVILGAALGVIRMGAIGGAAIRALSRPESKVVCVVGTGRQAVSHVEAAAAVRDIEEIRAYDKKADRCRNFGRKIMQRTGANVVPKESVREAVEGSDIVILATTSLRPVIKAPWLKPGCLVHTVGYKSPAGKEMGLDVAARAGLLVTDSLEQVSAFGRGFILHNTPYLDQLRDLGQIVSGKTPLQADPEDIRVCYPVGFSGSDVVVADDILGRCDRAVD